MVLDVAGSPLAGAEVHALADVVTFRATELASRPAERPSALATSGRDGVLDVPAHDAATRCVVSMPGYEPRLVGLGVGVQARREVVLRRAGGPLLVARDARGPLAGARVLLETASWGWPADEGAGHYFDAGTTDASGRWRLGARASSGVRGLVFAAGHCLQPFVLPNLDGTGVHPVELQPAAAVSGTALGPTRDERFFVVAERRADPGSLFFAAPVQDPGDFVLPALAAGAEWTLTPCTRRGEAWEPAGDSRSVVAPAEGVVLVIGDSIEVRVRALDPDGTVLEPAVLSSLMPREVLADPARSPARVEPDGRHVWPAVRWPFGGSPAAGSELWVGSPGHRTTSVGDRSFRPGDVVELGDVVLVPASTWEVEVVEAASGEPVEGALVRFLPAAVLETMEYDDPWLQEERTDAGGLARLVAPVGGAPGVVEATKAGWMAAKRWTDAGGLVRTRIALERPALVSVICESARGARAPGASIQWRPGDAPSAWKHAYADGEGVAEFLAPPGDVRVRPASGSLRGRSRSGSTIQVDLHPSAEGRPGHGGELAIRDLAAGEHRRVTLAVPALEALSVAVTLDSEPAAGYRVVGVPGTALDVVENDLWDLLDLPRDVTDDRGRCELAWLPDGAFTLAAIDPRTDLVASMVVRAGLPPRATLDFAIETKTVAATVLDAEGAPLPDVPLLLVQRSGRNGVRIPTVVSSTPGGTGRRETAPRRSVAGRTDASGRAVFRGLPRDAVLEVSCATPRAWPTLRGERVDSTDAGVSVVLRQGSAAVLDLRLTDPTGRFHASAAVMLRPVGIAGPKLLETTDPEGLVLFPALSPGTYSLQVASGDGAEFHLAAGEHHAETLVLR